MHKAMKQFSIRGLRLLLFLGIALTAISSEALRIDNTHYRFCVMDNAVISNYAAATAANSGTLTRPPMEATWYSYHGVKINGYQTELVTYNTVLSVNVLMTGPWNNSSDCSLSHRWFEDRYVGNVGSYQRKELFYITVDAPDGVALLEEPSYMKVGDDMVLQPVLLGNYTEFSGDGYFAYEYSSSAPEIIEISSGKIIAKNLGKATVTVKAYAENRTYAGKYFIGEAKTEIEVCPNGEHEETIDIVEINKDWGLPMSQVISSQNSAYELRQKNETNVIFSKTIKDEEIYIAYKFDDNGKLCASTLTMPETDFFTDYANMIMILGTSEITFKNEIEIMKDDGNIVGYDISTAANGRNFITIGFSYYDEMEDRDDCVDLGLSVRWATTNIGASKPSGVGGFYAWGETSTKSEYWRENYSYCSASGYDFNYFNPLADICGTQYDVATKKLGDGWRMPTLAEANELITKCTWTREDVEGVKVYRVTGPNGNSIIIPIVSWKKQAKEYTTSKLHLAVGECPSRGSDSAYVITTERQGNGYVGSIGQEWKAWGYNIRPVYTK